MTSKKPASPKRVQKTKKQARKPPGFRLFLRFADGCRHQLEQSGQISKKDSREIYSYLHGSGAAPSERTLKRVYHVAYPGLKRVQRRLGKESMFDTGVVREFYSHDHNRMMFDKGNLICIAYPAGVIRVRSVKPGSNRKPGTPLPACRATVELEPVTGIFDVESDIPLKKGDWVLIHRMNVIERIGKPLADRMISYLQTLGLDKSRTFPEDSYKYLTELRYTSHKRHLSGDFLEVKDRATRFRRPEKRKPRDPRYIELRIPSPKRKRRV